MPALLYDRPLKSLESSREGQSHRTPTTITTITTKKLSSALTHNGQGTRVAEARDSQHAVRGHARVLPSVRVAHGAQSQGVTLKTLTRVQGGHVKVKAVESPREVGRGDAVDLAEQGRRLTEMSRDVLGVGGEGHVNV